MRYRAGLVACALLGIALVARAEPAEPAVGRLVELCKLWGTVKYLHPAIVTRTIDWDAALVRAIPRVREGGDEENRKALQEMLAALGDPATRIVDATANLVGPPTSQPLTRWDERVLVLTPAAVKPQQPARPIVDEIGKAAAVVVDLRGTARNQFWAEALLDDLDDELAGVEVRTPATRVVYHEGYAPQRGGSSGGYTSGMKLVGGELLRPRKAAVRRVVFIADATAWMPPLVPALQAAGRARLLADGELLYAPVRRTLPLSGQKLAIISTGELETGPIHSDASVAGAGAVDRAIALARSGWTIKARPTRSLPGPAFPREKTYDDLPAPDLPHRFLALFRLWTIIDNFYPYRHLIGDWNAVLPELIPRFEAASDARSYALVVAEASTRVPDGHTGVSGHPALDSVLGTGAPLLRVRRVEGKPVVVDFPDPALVKDAGLAVGDVVVAVGGEPIEKRVEGLRPYITASTKAALENKLLLMALRARGADPVEIVVVKKDGSRKTASIVPSKEPYRPPPVVGEPWRALTQDIGYVDLSKLEVPQVQAMFAALGKSKAIVFDMRGYPRGTAWSIGPRLNVNNAKVGALFRRPVISGDSDETMAYSFEQPLRSAKERYAGKTVMLIDDRAISQSEHSGLFYEAAAGITFVGTPSAGANGDVTTFPLPGGIWFTFTGHDVRHADGRQLQRLGLIPHIPAAPTLAGIQAGKDEVLDRAVQWIRTGR